MRAGGRVGRVIFDRERLALALGIVRDDKLHRMQHAHRALSLLVEVLAQAVLKEAVFDHARALGNADAVAEVADRLGRTTWMCPLYGYLLINSVRGNTLLD